MDEEEAIYLVLLAINGSQWEKAPSCQIFLLQPGNLAAIAAKGQGHTIHHLC